MYFDVLGAGGQLEETEAKVSDLQKAMTGFRWFLYGGVALAAWYLISKSRDA